MYRENEERAYAKYRRSNGCPINCEKVGKNVDPEPVVTVRLARVMVSGVSSGVVNGSGVCPVMTGGSLIGVMVRVTVAWSVAPLPSRIS